MKVSRHPHRTRILVVLVVITMFMLGIASAITVQTQQSRSKKSADRVAAADSAIQFAALPAGIQSVIGTD
jgi:Tfp pilus assembly protein PilX